MGGWDGFRVVEERALVDFPPPFAVCRMGGCVQGAYGTCDTTAAVATGPPPLHAGRPSQAPNAHAWGGAGGLLATSAHEPQPQPQPPPLQMLGRSGYVSVCCPCIRHSSARRDTHAAPHSALPGSPHPLACKHAALPEQVRPRRSTRYPSKNQTRATCTCRSPRQHAPGGWALPGPKLSACQLSPEAQPGPRRQFAA